MREAQVVGCKIEAKYNLEQATVCELDELDKVAQINLERALALCC